MLDLKDLWLLLLVGVGAIWFWRAQGIREIALRATFQHCRGEEVSLLDQTVALRRVGLRRDAALRLRLWRRYQFEFTVTGGERYLGHTDMLGMKVWRITLPPHRFTSAPDMFTPHASSAASSAASSTDASTTDVSPAASSSTDALPAKTAPTGTSPADAAAPTGRTLH